MKKKTLKKKGRAEEKESEKENPNRHVESAHERKEAQALEQIASASCGFK